MEYQEEASPEQVDAIISLPNWGEALAQTAFSSQVKQDYRRDILEILRACTALGHPLSVGLIKWYLERPGATAGERSYERDALKWFYQTAQAAGAVGPARGLFAVRSYGELEAALQGSWKGVTS